MKLVFQAMGDEFTLQYAECSTVAEAEEFLGWYQNRTGAVVQMAEPETVTPSVTPEVEHVVPTGGVPAPTKITRSELSAAAMELMNTKGRNALQAVLDHFSAKRVSEIPDARMAEAFNRIKEVV